MMDTHTKQVFARKLVRPFGDVTREDVLNEPRAINALKAHGPCENLVLVIRHGWLPRSQYYFIDMELCDGNLEDYIGRKSGVNYVLSKNPRFFGATFMERGIWNTWDIMEQIAGGMGFMHKCKEVHRDLKPRNG
jgi:serine/threonine protein kinase